MPEPTRPTRPECVLPRQIYRETDPRFKNRRVQVLAVLGGQNKAVCQVVVHSLTPRAVGRKVTIRLDRLLRAPNLHAFYEFVSGSTGAEQDPDWPAVARPHAPVIHSR